METGLLKFGQTEVRYSILKDFYNNWLQFYYSVIPEAVQQIGDQIQTIAHAEKKLFERFGIGYSSIAFKRFFSSDLVTHYDEIMKYKLRQPSDFCLSLTEQPSANKVKLSLIGMCLNNIKEESKCRDGRFFSFKTTSDIQHIFAEHLVDTDADEHDDSEKQTERIFGLLQSKLSEFDTTLEESVLRTWIYTPHVDGDYPGIARARNRVFDSENLTKDTHFIASTGIQGGSYQRFTRVFMDAYAVTGVEKKRVRYIRAPEYLSPTHLYGVAFERGTAVELGKSDFLFISGTASIDSEGNIVYPGDVVKQTERTLENINALLQASEFETVDLSSFIVYLRDPADYSFVKPPIDAYSPKIPTVYVKAPVCRPGWLIEIEATAVRIKR